MAMRSERCRVLVFFFFSSRRRHTRCGRDWSSDVCSSDLGRGNGKSRALLELRAYLARAALKQRIGIPELHLRSEERRVGKECRSRWRAYQQKKKNCTDSRVDREQRTQNKTHS